MSIFVITKQGLFIAVNLIIVLLAVNSIHACLLSSSVDGNCGVTFTFTVIPLFLVSLIISLVWFLKTVKRSKYQALFFILIVLVMWVLAYVFSLIRVNNYL
jgi:hypothetical protein